MPRLGLSVMPSASATSVLRSSQAGFNPTSDASLKLWLKADAGVQTQSYSYKSSITLSLAGQSSINGTYTTSDPGGGNNNYTLVGPNDNRIEVRPNSTPRYRLYNNTNRENPNYGTPFYYDFVSSDGVTWTLAGRKPVSITISGLTGSSAGNNGTYNTFQWNPASGAFLSEKTIGSVTDGNRLLEVTPSSTGLAQLYALDPDFFIPAESNSWGTGTWTLVEGTGSPVATGTLYPALGVPTGAVTTTNVTTSNITQWNDQSGNNNNFSGISFPSLNANDLNSKPTISLSYTDYSGDDPWLYSKYFLSNTNPDIMGSVGTTAFAVVFVDDVCSVNNTNGAIFGNFGTAGDGSHYPYGPTCSVYDSFATENRKGPLTAPVTITNAWSLYSVVSTTNDWRAYINGQLMHSNNTNVYSNAINNSNEDGNGNLLIGYQSQNGDHYLNGKVAEILIYNRVLTTTERQQVQVYLNTKYAIY